VPRGGKRTGAGRKKLPLGVHAAKTKLEFADKGGATEPPDYLHIMQKKHRNFGVLSPIEIYKKTAAFLEKTGCLHLIHEDLIANYAVARHYLLCAQSELSETSFVARDKANVMYITTFGEAMLLLQKNVISTWNPIWEIVSRNCEKTITNPEKELSAILIGGRARKTPKGEPPDAEFAYYAENPAHKTDSGGV